MINPKISIIIPVFNKYKKNDYLKEAIDSALMQTYDNFEIIVVNDGSDDKGLTREIALSYGDKIKYYEKENGGVSTALNLGLTKMTGDYFSWLSHDDRYLSNKLEIQMDYLKKNDLLNEKVILYTDYNLIDRNSKLINECKKDHYLLKNKPEYSLLRGNVNGITLLIPKNAFLEYGNFNEELRTVQDYELWLKMFKTYKPIHLDTITAEGRYHPNQVSNTSPKVLSEGNPFWIKMIESVTDKDKKRLEGSIYNYYYEMFRFLKETPYKEAQQYCEEKCNKIIEETKKVKKDALVSVIIPFYNRNKETVRAIKSVLKQTYHNYEIILVNDASIEKTPDIIKLANKHSNIYLYNLKENGGPAKARNYGIEKAKGDFIAFLDSDDEWLEEKLEKQILKMEITKSNMSHTSYTLKKDNQESIVDSGKDFGMITRKLMYSCQIATPTVMIRKDFLDKNNYRFDSNLRIGEDTCFWLTLLKNEYLVSLEEPLTIVNSGKENAAFNFESQLIGSKTILKFLLNDDYYSQFDIEISYVAKSYIYFTRECFPIKTPEIYVGRLKNLYDRFFYSLKTEGKSKTLKKILNKVKIKLIG